MCPFDLEYRDWHYLAPLSWINMLWRTLQVMGFELHLEYETIPLPRTGDVLMMDKLREMTGNDETQLKALARVRGSLNVMFLSDIVTADGKFLEQHVTDVGCLPLKRSHHEFPREEPVQDDWETWISYMKVITKQKFELPTPLGDGCVLVTGGGNKF